MNELTKTRTADVIAAEILTIRENAVKVLLSASIEIGNRLIEAKELVPYGEWGNWLQQNFEYSQSTAANLMAIANEYEDKQYSMLSGKTKEELFGKLSYSQAVALLPLSEAEREEFVENHDVEKMSVRDINAEIKAEKEEAERVADGLKEELEKRKSELEKKDEARRELQEECDKLKCRLSDITDTLEQTREQSVIIKGLSAEEVEAEKSKAIAEVKRELQAEISKLTSERDSASKNALELEDEVEKLKAEAAEKLEAEISKRLETVASEKAALERRLAASADKEVFKFGALCEALQGDFAKCCETLDRVADEGMRAKLRAAFKSIIDKMSNAI